VMIAPSRIISGLGACIGIAFALGLARLVMAIDSQLGQAILLGTDTPMRLLVGPDTHRRDRHRLLPPRAPLDTPESVCRTSRRITTFATFRSTTFAYLILFAPARHRNCSG
jgi:hypothetical protein